MSKRILLVDDDPDHELLLEIAALDSGGRVVGRVGDVASLGDAVARTRPDVIVLDVWLSDGVALDRLDEVRAAVDQVAGAIELVGSRFAGGLDGKGRLLVTADSGADMALILGAMRPFMADTDLRGHGVAMQVNGETRGEGTGARALGDPLKVLHWLVNQQSQWGRGMFKGEWIATGTCTGLDLVRPDDIIAADFGDLGVVELALETG